MRNDLATHAERFGSTELDHIVSSIRHNRIIRDVLTQFLTEVCPNVAIEPAMQPLSGESFPHRSINTDDGARLDVKAQNFAASWTT